MNKRLIKKTGFRGFHRGCQIIGCFLIGMMLPVTSLAASEKPAAEKILYQASYKGVFSLYQSMKIADVVYRVSDHPLDTGQSMQQVHLWVTSQRFATVEKLYPFRYLYKSFFEPIAQQTLVFENIKQTGKAKRTRHQVGLLDVNRNRVQLFSSQSEDALLSPVKISGIISQADFVSSAKALDLTIKGRALENLPVLPIDRLTLLELIQLQLANNQAVENYRVTNGDELFDYRVTLLQQEPVRLAGKDFATRKVKIEAFEKPDAPLGQPSDQSRVRQPDQQVDGQMTGELFDSEMSHLNVQQTGYAHAPVYAWFSSQAPHRAVKFVNHHTMGQFVIEMVNAEK